MTLPSTRKPPSGAGFGASSPFCRKLSRRLACTKSHQAENHGAGAPLAMHPDQALAGVTDKIVPHLYLSGTSRPMRCHVGVLRDEARAIIGLLVQADGATQYDRTDFVKVVEAEPDGPDRQDRRVLGLSEREKLDRIHEISDREMRWKTAVLGAELGVWDHDLVRGARFVFSGRQKIRSLAEDSRINDT